MELHRTDMTVRSSISNAPNSRPPKGHASKKSWRMPLLPQIDRRANSNETLSDDRSRIQTDMESMEVKTWWKIRLFRGIVNDIRRRAPYYWSDWVDAWDYRVIPATVYMYFVRRRKEWDWSGVMLMTFCRQSRHSLVSIDSGHTPIQCHKLQTTSPYALAALDFL